MSGVSIELLPGLRIGSPDPEISAALEVVYGKPDQGDASEIWHQEDGRLTRNGIPLFPLNGCDLPPLIESLVNHRCGLECDWLVLHAGHVRWGDQDLLISGDRGSGKSTLVAELAARNATYGSDELTALNLESGELRSIYKAITIKAEHSPLARPERPSYADPFRGPLQYIDPLSEPGTGIRNPVLLFPWFDPDAEPQLLRLDESLAFMALGQQTFGGLQTDPRRAEHLAELVRKAPAYQLIYSDTEQALEFLDEIQKHPHLPRVQAEAVAEPQEAVHHPAAQRELRSVWQHARAGDDVCASPTHIQAWLELVHAHRLDGLLTVHASPLQTAQPAAGRGAARRAISDLVDLERVLEDTGNAGILLKGASYLGPVYEVAAERSWSDVDLLFFDADAAQHCFNQLIGKGYQAGQETVGHHHLPPLRHPIRPISVELHTDLSSPRLGEQCMTWFRERVTETNGWKVLNQEALRAATAIHAMNDPVDSPLLRSLLEFAALDTPEHQAPDHQRVQASIQLCRRMLTLLQSEETPQGGMERLLWRNLGAPADLRTGRVQRYRAVLDRAAVERWHHGHHRLVPAAGTSNTAQRWSHAFPNATATVNLRTGELSLSPKES